MGYAALAKDELNVKKWVYHDASALNSYRLKPPGFTLGVRKAAW